MAKKIFHVFLVALFSFLIGVYFRREDLIMDFLNDKVILIILSAIVLYWLYLGRFEIFRIPHADFPLRETINYIQISKIGKDMYPLEIYGLLEKQIIGHKIRVWAKKDKSQKGFDLLAGNQIEKIIIDRGSIYNFGQIKCADNITLFAPTFYKKEIKKIFSKL